MFHTQHTVENCIWENEDVEGNNKEGENKEGENKEGRTFTQAEVDKMITNRTKNMKAQLQAAERNYESVLSQSNLTEEQRATLENDLKNVQAQMRSKEQNLLAEKEKLSKKAAEELRLAAEQRDHYKNLFETSTIDRAIIDAASRNDGHDPTQFIPFLRSSAKLVPELDAEGNKTGNYVPVVEARVKDEKGVSQLVLQTPEEAIKSMQTTHPNLFKSNVARGINQGNSQGFGGGKIDYSNLTMEQYTQLRKDPAARKAMGLS